MNAVPPTSAKEDEARSLDIVQRVIISGLVIVVLGAPAIVLAVYVSGPRPSFASGDDALGLWVMSGFIGLVAAATILVINRRRPYAPWVVLGLLPMAISAYWVLT